MTSKILFNKLIKENIQQRSWLVALSFILLFLGQTVRAMIRMENVFSGGITDEILNILQKDFPGMINGNSIGILSLVIPLLGVMTAVTGLTYLHATEKTDFFHGLPLSRTQLFSVSYIGGITIFVLPYTITTVCTLLAGSFFKLLTSRVLLDCTLAYLSGILGFLLFYHVALLGMMLAGKTVPGLLMTVVIAIYGTLINTMIPALAQLFFDTWNGNSSSQLDSLLRYSSPAALYASIISDAADGKFAISLNVVILLFLAASALLILFIYRRRPSEAAGQALAFPKMAPYIKILITIPVSLYGGLFVNLYNSSDKKWVIFFSILTAVLLCGVIEFIYHPDLKMIFSGKVSSLISIFSVIGIICILQFDLAGYDTWIPRESDVESISLYAIPFGEYFSYPPEECSGMSKTPDPLFDKEGEITDFMPLYQLAEEGIKNAEIGISQNTIYSDIYEEEDYIELQIRYKLKNGHDRLRVYAVRRDSALEALSVLCENDAYRKYLFPAFYLNEDTVQKVSMTDIYEFPAVLSLSDEEMAGLIKAYRNDVLSVSIKELQEKSPVGELTFEFPSVLDYTEYGITSPSTKSGFYEQSAVDYTTSIGVSCFFVYDSCKNTLEFLEDLGYTFRTQIQPEDVTQMTLITGQEYREDQMVAINDPEEMKEILSRISYSSCGILGSRHVSEYSVEITLSGENYPNNYPLP